MIPHPDLLRSFVAVAEHGSYTRAATLLLLSQPTVYQHVRRLERAYGVRLVEQVGKRVRLTEQGHIVYRYARRLEEMAGEISDELANHTDVSRGSLVLAAATSAGEFVLPTICIGFQRRYPHIQIRLLIVNAPRQIDEGVRDRHYDLGFHAYRRTADGLTFEAFHEEQLVCIAPPGHRLATMNAIAPADLTSEMFALFPSERGAIVRAMTDAWLRRAGAEARCRFESNSLESLKAAVRSGGGVALVSDSCVRPDDPSLVVRPLVNAPRRRLYMVGRSGDWQSQLLEAFRGYVLSGAWCEPAGTNARANTGSSALLFVEGIPRNLEPS